MLLRAFFRPSPALAIEEPDERWVDGAVQALWPALGVTGEPARTWVARWPNAIARYAADHADRVARTRAALDEQAPGLELAGAAYCSAGVAGGTGGVGGGGGGRGGERATSCSALSFLGGGGAVV